MDAEQARRQAVLDAMGDGLPHRAGWYEYDHEAGRMVKTIDLTVKRTCTRMSNPADWGGLK